MINDFDSVTSDALPEREPFRDSALVIEFGSHSVKIFTLNDATWKEVPPVLLRSNKGKFGNAALKIAETRGGELISPFKLGVVDDWNLLVDFLDLIFRESLTDASVIICESVPTANSLAVHREQRKKLAEKLVKTFNVQAFFTAPQPFFTLCHFNHNLSLRHSGVVIDVGHSQTRISVIFRGTTLPSCTVVSDIGGNLFDEMLFKLFVIKNLTSDRAIRFKMEEIKKDFCYVATKNSLTEHFHSNLKDKKKEKILEKIRKKIKILAQNYFIDEERFLVPELLFNPTVIQTGYGKEHSLSYLVEKSKQSYETFKEQQISRNNADYQNEAADKVFSKIYLVGGSTKMKGMIERMRSEITDALVNFELSAQNLTKEDFDSMKERLEINFYTRENNDERGKEAIKGGVYFANAASNRDWIYDVQIEREKDIVVERCPK